MNGKLGTSLRIDSGDPRARLFYLRIRPVRHVRRQIRLLIVRRHCSNQARAKPNITTRVQVANLQAASLRALRVDRTPAARAIRWDGSAFMVDLVRYSWC